MRFFLMIGLLAGAAFSAQAQPPAAPPPKVILFVGNSFTYGGGTRVHTYNAAAVTDESPGEKGVGGIPAIFKKFTDETGMRYEVHVETVGGKDLEFHYAHALSTIAQQKWDIVILQGYSTEALPAERGGNPESFVKNAVLLEKAIHAANPAAKIYLYETWAYPFKTYTEKNSGDTTPLFAMSIDLGKGYRRAAAEDGHIEAVVPVGGAWETAESQGIAQSEPAAREENQVNLWDTDGKHPSVAGSYLCALTLFEGIARYDVNQFGGGEQAAHDLGIAPDTAVRLQMVANLVEKVGPTHNH